jgi:crotonobetainyl-CoA:carnitine CoA-transferase CaiB-like acyl-CoA transferase
MAPKHVLDGYRVLDFTQYLAGPAATNLMVQMGAEVIKLEIGPHGEPVRNFPYCRDGRSGYFVQQNRGKKSLCLDPRHPEGLAIIKRLLKHCDVFVENFAPGVIGRLGLGWEEVHKINPNLIMCSISAFGQEGPLASHPGFDYIAQAYAAVSDLIGEPDSAPSMPMLAFGDVGTGVHALTAVGYALLDRERNDAGGQWLDISLLDSYFHYHEVSVQAYSASGGRITPRRSGSHHYAVGPSGIFKAREGHLMILALLHQWPILCRAMGREELIEDPRFRDNDARMAHRDAMIALIEDWLQSLPSDAAALALLEKARIPCAPILSVPEAMAHPHLIERRTVRTIEDRLLGKFQIPGMPLRFSKYEVDENIQAPLLGEHNAEVLKRLLLCPAEQVRDWERRQVLFAKPV